MYAYRRLRTQAKHQRTQEEAHVHMHKAYVCSSARNLNLETAKQKSRAQIKTPILTAKHTQDIKKTIKLT